MMEAETVSETFDCNCILTGLIAREYLIATSFICFNHVNFITS
jgi:hypothetical protein